MIYLFILFYCNLCNETLSDFNRSVYFCKMNMVEYFRFGMKYAFRFLFVCTLWLQISDANATHFRAGEILAKKVGNLQYEFTVIIYKNSESGAATLESVTLNFGDNTNEKLAPNPIKTKVAEFTDKYTFTFNKNYSSAGTYKVWIKEVNRNAGIINMTNSEMVNFYLETQITIDPYIGQNSSPELKVPPIDVANQNQTFTHNPGAWDADGDSLVYKLGVPKNLTGDTAEVVPGYKSLTDPIFSTATCFSTLGLDPKKGDLVWNTPCKPGLYNIAIIVEEYRNGKLIGFITRDMQITVLQFENKPPKLSIPKDTCFTAGGFLSGTITGTDVAFTQLNLTAFSGVFQLANSPANTILQSGSNPQATPAIMYFNWQTTCQHIRQEAYDVQFKVEDNPTERTKLATIKTWSIRVVAPKPTGLRATTMNKTITLKWNKYSCSNATKLYIMRKDCPSDSSAADSCTKGYQSTLAFEKLAEVKATDTTYIDTKGLKRGAVYCYRLYAIFPQPAKGESRSSNELCVTLSTDVPIIFRTSVDTLDGTSATNGKIHVAWATPKKIDSTRYPPPYSYQLWRKENKNVVTKITQFFGFTDTTFTDTGLNTVDNTYAYFIDFLYSPEKKIRETTDTSSSVFLQGFSKKKRAILKWKYNVPWDNTGKYHYVWRFNDTTFQLIDSVYATSDLVSYTDVGKYKNKPLENGKKYTYYVTTQGDYTCPDQVQRVNLPFLLRNSSNRVSVIPSDTNRPCPPKLRIFATDCSQQPVIPKISWRSDLSVYCDSSIASYSIYYSPENQNTFRLLATANAQDTLFVHQNNTAPSGCYYITAQNTTNLESAPSNTVCNELNDKCNYFYFELPNVFTPNGDGVNDVFIPKPIPQFVQSLDFKVYNRWGMKIFSTREIGINWDGGSVTDGLYYYSATIVFGSVKNGSQTQERHGWIQVVR